MTFMGNLVESRKEPAAPGALQSRRATSFRPLSPSTSMPPPHTERRFTLRHLSRGGDASPPRDTFVATGVCKTTEQVAVTCFRSAEADEIAVTQFIERAKKLMLVGKPALVTRDDCIAVTVRSDPERIAPPRSAADIHRAGGDAVGMLVQNPAHCLNLRAIR
jgi:hypothetical protein